jgi:hypothetical protein
MATCSLAHSSAGVRQYQGVLPALDAASVSDMGASQRGAGSPRCVWAVPVSGDFPQMSLPPSVSEKPMGGRITTFPGQPACAGSLRAPPGVSVAAPARAPPTLWRCGCVAHPRHRGRRRLAGAWASGPSGTMSQMRPPARTPRLSVIYCQMHPRKNGLHGARTPNPIPKGAPAPGVVALPGTPWHLPGPAADCQPARLPTCQRATSRECQGVPGRANPSDSAE